MMEETRDLARGTARRLAKAVDTVREAMVPPVLDRSRAPSPGNGGHGAMGSLSSLASWATGRGTRTARRSSTAPDPRVLRSVAEVRRLVAYVYGFPYPILDRDRVYGSLAHAQQLLRSNDAPRALEELEELRSYLVTHLIIAEAALMEDEPKHVPDRELARILDV